MSNKLVEAYINLLTERASIDWNNYLTQEEVKQFLAKDDKVESAEEIIYNIDGPWYQKYWCDFKDDWTKRELTQDLANFYFNGHLITESNTLPKNVKEIKNIRKFLRDTIPTETNKEWKERLKDADTCDHSMILNKNTSPLKYRREIIQQYLDYKNNENN